MTVEENSFMVQSPATREGRCGCATGSDVESTLGQIGAKAGVGTNTSATKRTARTLAVTANDIGVVHADPRMFAITVNLSGHLIGFVSFHAPDTSKGAVTSECWCNACSILRRFRVDVVPWIGIDANMALPEVWASAVARGPDTPLRRSVCSGCAAISSGAGSSPRSSTSWGS